MNEGLLKNIKALPPLPDTVIKVRQICADPEASLADLSKVVEKDPMITANILKATNSPLYGFSREIHSVNQAVSLFGMSTVKGFAIATAVSQTFAINLAPYGVSSDTLSRVSQMQSSLAFNWLRSLDKTMVDVLLTASFLLETGAIVISDYLVKNKKDGEFRAAITAGKPLREVELEFVGTTNGEVAAKIFEQWNFDELLVNAIRYCAAPESADARIFPFAAPLAVIRAAVNLREQLTEGSLNTAYDLINKYNLNITTFQAAVETVRQEG